MESMISHRHEPADLLREAYIMSSCSHPNVAIVYGVALSETPWVVGGGDGTGGHALVMRFYQRGSLADVLEEARLGVGPLSAEQRMRMVVDIARGMAYLHGRPQDHQVRCVPSFLVRDIIWLVVLV